VWTLYDSNGRIGFYMASFNYIADGIFPLKDYQVTYVDFDKENFRIDFQGRMHAGVLPHIHIYVYPDRGGRIKYTFDMNWNLID